MIFCFGWLYLKLRTNSTKNSENEKFKSKKMLNRIKSWKTTLIGIVMILATLFGWEGVEENAGITFDLLIQIAGGIAGLLSIFGLKDK